MAVVAAIFQLQGTKRHHPSDGAAATAQTARDRYPFRSAVMGRRIECIDATGGRRREDYERSVTSMRQLTSTEGLTLIFDGTKLTPSSTKMASERVASRIYATDTITPSGRMQVKRSGEMHQPKR